MTCTVVIALAFRDTPENGMIEGPADRIVVEKHAHTLTLYRQGNVLKTYRVALGRGGIGPKVQAGDNRVPEGVYRIMGRNSHSAIHLAFEGGLSNSRSSSSSAGSRNQSR